jgi:hypothetical protein
LLSIQRTKNAKTTNKGGLKSAVKFGGGEIGVEYSTNLDCGSDGSQPRDQYALSIPISEHWKRHAINRFSVQPALGLRRHPPLGSG